jgi:NADH dehydrogenase
MAESPLHVVTGAFGYTGKYIAGDLLARGSRVRTLTNSLSRGDPFGGRVEVHPLDFKDRHSLVESLRGAEVLYNTYWVRYDHNSGAVDFGYSTAVENTRVLFDCAAAAGVRRVIHLSVANASDDSDWGYFGGKARLEHDLQASGLPHSIVRPTVIFGGPENVLINNIAWMLRRFPVFGVFGRGDARLTPVHVEDVARICVEAAEGVANETLNAVGPDTFTYKEMVRLMATAMGLRRAILPMPNIACLWVGKLMGVFLRDIVITRHEIAGLQDESMYTGTEPLGATHFHEWLKAEHRDLGRRYMNDLARRQ